MRITSTVAVVLMLAASVCAQRARERGSNITPKVQPFSEETLKRLKVPAEFQVNVFARDLRNARMMVTGEDGSIYVTRQDQDDVLQLRDGDSHGAAQAGDAATTAAR